MPFTFQVAEGKTTAAASEDIRFDNEGGFPFDELVSGLQRQQALAAKMIDERDAKIAWLEAKLDQRDAEIARWRRNYAGRS